MTIQPLPLPRQQTSLITEAMLSAATTEATLLALMQFNFEAKNAQSFRKTIASALNVSERYVGDLLHGKANATPTMLRTIAIASGTKELLDYWLTIHIIEGGNDATQVSTPDNV